MRLITLFLLSIFTSGCALYESAGKKDFEQQTFATLNTNIGVASVCFVQPAHQELWSHDLKEPVTTSAIDSENMQVCGEPQ